jgi:hypothetical protein
MQQPIKNNKQQTAVDWLFKALWEEPKDKMVWYAILNKAKEIEKKQIENALNVGHCIANEDERYKHIQTTEQYYNETYNN